MSNQYRFNLDKSSKKFTCPQCEKRTFVRYKDNESNTYFEPDYIGRCDREGKCNYHFPPKAYFEKNPSLKSQKPFIPKQEIIEIEPPSFIHSNNYEDYRNVTTKYLHQCGFLQYLINLFANDDKFYTDDFPNGISKRAARIITYYKLTAAGKTWIADGNYFDGVIFWQFDYQNQIRTAKIMRYNATTGRRIKKPKSYIHWLHSILKYQKKISKFNLNQCFFGEHLLNEFPSKRVAIVESEKTACLMSQIFTDFIWLATGGSNGAKWREASVYKVLYGRDVVLFPDLGQFDKWNAQSKLFQSIGLRVECSDLLEIKTCNEDKKEGFDIADYAIANQWYL
jgi:hypothetical protein